MNTEATEKLWELSDLIDHEANCNNNDNEYCNCIVGKIKNAIVDMDIEIQEELTEHEKMKDKLDEEETKVFSLEKEIEDLEENHYCEEVCNCPFDGNPPELKSLADQERFEKAMEEL